jgi:hypothetical protein
MLTSGFAITALVCIFLLTIGLLLHYPAKGTKWYVYFWVFISWFLAFWIIVLIPFDVYLVVPSQTLTPTATESDKDSLRLCWRVVYWTVFVLCWLVLPILQEYEMAGEYTRLRKLKRAIRRLLWMFFLMATAGLIFIIYLGFIGELVIARLPYVLVAFSNCWGLFQTILLLGYGLVAVPKYLWFESNFEHYLHYLAYKAALVSEEKNDLQLELFTLGKLANAVQLQVSKSSKMLPFIEEILSRCREEDMRYHREHETHKEREVQEELGEITLKKLEVLNRLLKQAAFSHHRACAQWEQILTAAFNTMDLIDSGKSAEKIVTSVLWDRHKERKRWVRVAQWVWFVYVKPVLFRLLAVALGGASLIIIAGESTLFLSTPVGLLPLLFQHDHGDWLTQLYCALPLAYLVSCCYFALFHLKLSGFYGFYGENQTDAPCLAWNAAYLARMACPLSLNFLLFIKITDAEFFKVMRVIDFVPFMGESFCIWFPLLLIIFCALSLFDVYPLLLEWLGFPQFIMGHRSNKTRIETGLALLTSERSKAESRFQVEASDYTHTVGRRAPLLPS